MEAVVKSNGVTEVLVRARGRLGQLVPARGLSLLYSLK